MPTSSSSSSAREQRRRTLGIDSLDRVVWKSWESGEEHVRRVVIKNIEARAQVITCQLPQRKTVFLTPFPEPITLRAGMSYELEVRFKPTELVELHDSIEVEVEGRGSFSIFLECLTPFAKLRAPPSHDFDVCPVYGTTTHDMIVQNAGTVPMSFYWDVPTPFAMSPVRGDLEPGASMTITVHFSPDDARVMIAQAVCRMTEIEEVLATVKLSGIGKLPHTRLVFPLSSSESQGGLGALGKGASTVRASNSDGAPVLRRPQDCGPDAASSVGVIAFGRVSGAGSTPSAQFTVENPSPVPAVVTIQRLDDALICPFTVTPISASTAASRQKPLTSTAVTAAAGTSTILMSPALPPGAVEDGGRQLVVVIPSGGAHAFKVSCKAAGLPAGLALRNEFQIQTAAASPLRVVLTGIVAGARVRSSTTAVDFGNVDLDSLGDANTDALAQTVDLRNTGDVSAVFNVLATSPGAAFTVEPCTGVIAARGHTTVCIRFCPSFPMNYLRRLYIAVEGAAEALFIDVFGTAYNREERALPFGLREVEAYQLRMHRGLGCLGPAELTALAAASRETSRALTDEEETLLHVWCGIENELGGSASVGGAGLIEKRRNTVDHDTLVSDVFFFSAVGGSARAAGRCPYAVECKSPLMFGAVGDAANPYTTTMTIANVVSVLNTSNTPARAFWCVPAASPFCVVPEQQEVLPGESVQFQVRLKDADYVPLQPVVSQSLECYVHPACTASFRLLEKEGFVPPTCFTVPCEVHRAPSATGTGVSAGSASTLIRTLPVAVFRPCLLNQSGYVVAALENTSDVALTFQWATVTMQEVSELVVDDLGALLTMQDGTAKALTVAEANTLFPPEGLRRAATVRAAARATFGCFPTHGVLAPRTQTLVLLHFLPPDLARYEAKAVFTIGRNERDLFNLSLRAEATIPRLCLTSVAGAPCQGASESRCVMPPTCVTGEASLPVSLVNPTSLPVVFQVQPTEALLSVVRCEPTYGLVAPGATLKATVFFSPEEARGYEGMISYVLRADVGASSGRGDGGEAVFEESVVDPTIAAAVALAIPTGAGTSSQGSPGSTHDSDAHVDANHAPVALREYVLSIPFKGEGVPARVELEPSTVDYAVDEMVRKSGALHPTIPLTLFNSGLCAVQYEVGIMKTRAGDDDDEAAGEDSTGQGRGSASAISLRYHVGTLPARAHTTVLLTVDARGVHGLCEYVVYTLVAGVGTQTALVASPKTVVEAMRHPHCRVTLRGLRPAVQITDVRSLTQQRSLLWEQLAINSINEALAAVVEPADRRAQASYAFTEYIAGLQPIPLDLGVGEPDMVPFIASLLLENTGDCPTTYEVCLPMDSDAHEETWFVEDAALREMQAIVDNSTIEITPRRGTIAVGGSAVLTITYRFQTVGVHTLPVLLRVHDGRRVLLVLEGRTLPAEVNAIALHHGSAYTLLPVALGDLEPPMQGIVVENPYDRPVEYHVQTDALRRLADENCGFPVLQCVNPSGVLAPRSVVQLLWYFRPLEAKEYVMDIPIDIVGGESYALTFTASGYHPHHTTPADVRAATACSFLRLPVLPRLSLFPALPVVLSQDVCTLGAVPYFSLHRRTVWLENHHPTHTYSFLWDTRHTGGDHVVRVEPESGVLEAGGCRVACKLTFYAGSTSQLLQWPASCLITNETKLRESEAMMASANASAGPQVARAATSATVNDIDIPLPAATGGASAANGRSARRRQPVAAPTLKTMGVRALTREVEQARRRQRAVETQVRHPGAATQRRLDGQLTLTCSSVGNTTGPMVMTGGDSEAWAAADLTDMEEAAVVWNALELLIQARVMSVDDYVLYYGSEALARHHLPPLVRHQLPRGPDAVASARRRHMTQKARLWSPETNADTAEALRHEGLQLTRSVLDEMLRTVVSDAAVAKAFVEPYIPKPVTYHDLITAVAVNAQKTTQRAAHEGEKRDGSPLPPGTLTNAVEEALDTVLFDAINAAIETVAQSLSAV